MGRDEEGGRAVELLAGGPQDPQALLALARHQHSVLRSNGRPRHGRSPRRLAHLRLGLGRYRAARVSRLVSACRARPFAHCILTNRPQYRRGLPYRISGAY